MPVNLTFAGKHGQDANLLKYAYAFEIETRHRMEPPVTPVLMSDRIGRAGPGDIDTSLIAPSSLEVVSSRRLEQTTVQVTGSIVADNPDDIQLEAFVDGRPIPQQSISRSGRDWIIESEYDPYHPLEPMYGGMALTVRTVNMIVLARSGGTVVAGKLVMIP